MPRREILLWVVLALAARGSFEFATCFTGEDALITLRVSRNLAEGKGLTYQEGERIQASSAPLFAAAVGVAGMFGVDVVATAKILAVACDACACGVFAATLAACISLPWVRCAAAAYATSPFHATWAVSGMETGVVSLLSILSWALWMRGRAWGWGIAAGFLVWCRLDGGVLVALLLAADAARSRAVPWRPALAAAAVAAPWHGWAWMHFGSPFPQSVIAKWATAGQVLSGASTGDRLWVQFVAKIPGVSPLLLSLFAVGLLLSLRRVGPLTPFLAWLPLSLGSFALSGVRLFEWYLVPPLAAYIAGIAVGAEFLARRLGPRVPAAGLALVMAAGTCSLAVQSRRVAEVQRYEDEVRRPLAQWLRERSAPGEAVALEPIGLIGYFSRLRMLETSGRAFPEALSYWTPWRRPMLERIAERHAPRWIVARRWVFRRAPSLAAGGHRYRLARTFATSSPEIPDFNETFDVYERSPRDLPR